MCFGTPNPNQDRVEKPGITHYWYLRRVLLYLWSAADGGGLIFDRDSSERNDLLRRNVHGGTIRTNTDNCTQKNTNGTLVYI